MIINGVDTKFGFTLLMIYLEVGLYLRKIRKKKNYLLHNQ